MATLRDFPGAILSLFSAISLLSFIKAQVFGNFILLKLIFYLFKLLCQLFIFSFCFGFAC